MALKFYSLLALGFRLVPLKWMPLLLGHLEEFLWLSSPVSFSRLLSPHLPDFSQATEALWPEAFFSPFFFFFSSPVHDLSHVLA